MTIEQQIDAAMRRIQKHINAACGQHKRAIRAAFDKAGAPVCGSVELPPQRRLILLGKK